MAKQARPLATPLVRNIKLRLLKLDVDDDRFEQIMSDFAGLIRRSERAWDNASAQGNEDYARAVADTESDYLEELIGASFLVLQTKIRRVQQAAQKLARFMDQQHGVAVSGLDRKSVMTLGGSYGNTGHSQIELIWAVGNYYKHRDEWSPDVWKERRKGETGRDPLGQSRSTRKVIQEVGIMKSSSGNMRTAYEFFGIDPYSNCAVLAEQVQAWAKTVYKKAQEQCRS